MTLHKKKIHLNRHAAQNNLRNGELSFIKYCYVLFFHYFYQP